MSDNIELTGDKLMEMLKPEVEENYDGTVVEMYIEEEEPTKRLWACFLLKDKIGIVKIPLEMGGIIEDNKISGATI